VCEQPETQRVGAALRNTEGVLLLVHLLGLDKQHTHKNMLALGAGALAVYFFFSWNTEGVLLLVHLLGLDHKKYAQEYARARRG